MSVHELGYRRPRLRRRVRGADDAASPIRRRPGWWPATSRCCCRRWRRCTCSRSRRRAVARPAGRVLGRDRRVGGAVVRRAARLGGRRAAARDADALVQVAHRAAVVRLGAAADRAGRLAASSRARKTPPSRWRIDVAVLVFLTGFLYWSLIIAPANNPAQASMGLRSLAIIGPIVRLASVVGLLLAAASAGKSAWAGVYRRLALGMALAFVILIVLSIIDGARQLRHRIAGRHRLDAAVLLRGVGRVHLARIAGPASASARRVRCRRRRRCCCSSRCSAFRSSATACGT